MHEPEQLPEQWREGCPCAHQTRVQAVAVVAVMDRMGQLLERRWCPHSHQHYRASACSSAVCPLGWSPWSASTRTAHETSSRRIFARHGLASLAASCSWADPTRTAPTWCRCQWKVDREEAGDPLPRLQRRTWGHPALRPLPQARLARPELEAAAAAVPCSVVSLASPAVVSNAADTPWT